MTTKAEVKQTCDKMVERLAWIDTEPDSEIIQQMKIYRQKLIEYPDIYVEGTMIVFPLDPRIKIN